MDNLQSYRGEIRQGGGSSAQQYVDRLLLKLETRVQSLELKMGSISKIVRLLQQYSEKKDKQYQMQTQNIQQIYRQLRKHESLEAKYEQIMVKCDQAAIDLRQCSSRVQEANVVIRDMGLLEAKLSEDMTELTTKINKIEAVFLQQLKQNTISNCQILTRPVCPNYYQLDHISFKLNQLIRERPKLKNKPFSPNRKAQRSSPKSSDDYGMFQQKRTCSKNQKDFYKNRSPLKRVRSK